MRDNKFVGHQVEATLSGQSALVGPGFHGDAFVLGYTDYYAIIPENANRCFGNIVICNNGMAVALWMKMSFPGSASGGESTSLTIPMASTQGGSSLSIQMVCMVLIVKYLLEFS